jgi:hypothetical protein
MPARASERFAASVALTLLALSAPARAVDVGAGERARSALGSVDVVEPGEPGGIVAAAGLNGGVTEGLSDTDSAHARFCGTAAAAVDATRWLNLGAWLRGRYDLHPRDVRGVDDGFLVEPEISARLAWRLGALGVGFEAAAWVPGGPDLGTSFSALSADGRVLVSGQASALVLAGYAGYRLDRSAKAAGDASRLRVGDRSALGVSDYDAMLAGFGVGYPFGETLLFGAVAAQLLLGSPKLAASPVWLTLGVRRPVGPPGLSAELSFEALASARPDVAVGAPLFPIEPRVSLHFGASYRFGRAPTAEVVVSAPPPAPPPPLPPKPTSVELELLDDRGQPLSHALVAVARDGVEVPLSETAPGRYRLEQARPGRAHLRIKADGFKPVERDIDVGGGVELRLDVRAEQALPAGQVRGLVRSFRGKPLAAGIRVEPGGVETKTDAEGFFQIDMPPGEYEVVIDSAGYEPQRRRAKIDEHGVVIVNADLTQRSVPAAEPLPGQP